MKLADGITSNNQFDVSKIDKFQFNLELKKYKTDGGAPNFPMLFDIPVDNRISAMAKKDIVFTVSTICVALTLCFETMNLSRPMTNSQIADLAEAIIDSSDERDKISLEDLLLFMQKLTRGEYAPVYEGMDIPKFMERFDVYRDQRWEVAKRLRDEKNEYYKGLGEDISVNERKDRVGNSFDEHMANFTNKIQQQKDEIYTLKKENDRLRGK
jgi:hypothetical protein